MSIFKNCQRRRFNETQKANKSLKVSSPIRIVLVSGAYLTPDRVQYWDNYYKPLNTSIAECHVLNVRHVHDLQLPDYQDFIEIKIQGGNDND